MKVATNPPKNVLLKDWDSFVIATRNELFRIPEVVVIETSQDYQHLTRRLQSQIRPFAIAVLTANN